MTLDEYMKANELTDKCFGEHIGKSRVQIYRYRNGIQIPGKEAMRRISEVTGAKVTPASFYQE